MGGADGVKTRVGNGDLPCPAHESSNVPLNLPELQAADPYLKPHLYLRVLSVVNQSFIIYLHDFLDRKLQLSGEAAWASPEYPGPIERVAIGKKVRTPVEDHPGMHGDALGLRGLIHTAWLRIC